MSQPTRACPSCHTPLPGMASFCYVCGTATPAGLNRETGEAVTVTGRSGIGPADLIRKLQRALGPGYELQERIGAGGFAEVFRARDLRLKRDLAVKVLRPDLGLSPDLLQRFRREAETIATLRNAHIVPVFDIGEAEGLAFIMMPLIAGESLRGVLDREKSLPPDEVRRILREAALGLAAAHDAGVVHRDIKPENIMLEGREKRVLLMDFGISKAVGAATDEEPGKTLTTTGIIIGTPQYMSPEQACGDKSIDARSDQYSLAVVGYRMLAGALPFEGESTRAVLYQQLVAEPPPIATKVAGIPEGLANAIQRAMAKDPAERFANMIEFAATLESDVGYAQPARTAIPPAPRRRHWVMSGIFAACVIVGALAWVLTRPKAGSDAAGTLPSTVATTPTPPPVTVAPPVAAPTPASPGKTVAQAPAVPTAVGKSGASKSAGAAPGRAAGANPASPPTTGPATPGCAKLASAENWGLAAAACTKEAQANNAAAQRILGTMYDKGTGVEQNPTEAVAWYRKAAPTDMDAKLLLSKMVENGRGTARNEAESESLLREAAAGGMMRAQQVLASRLENGAGVKKDEAEAAVWYRRAADHGDVISQQKLGEFLAKGHGLAKNETEALEWYRKAGDQGSGDAAWQAAQMYFKGKGTAKDETAGMEWLRKAAAVNQPDAVKELKKRTGNG